MTDIERGDVVKLTEDWTVLTQGQRYVVLQVLEKESALWGPSVHLGLVEPGGRWSANRWVPIERVRVDKAATKQWKELNASD